MQKLAQQTTGGDARNTMDHGESKRGVALHGLVKSPQNLIGGLAMALLAIVALIAVKDLPGMRGFQFAAGTAPRMFAYLLLGLGLAIAVTGFLERGPKLEHFPWRGPLLIIGAILFFGLSIRTLGLAVTGFVSVLIASLAVSDAKPVEAVIFAAAITAFCVLLFPIALGQPIPLLPSFLRY
jgi:putative tricarboxylic transport membrane protein